MKKAIVDNVVFAGIEYLQYHLATEASKTGLGCVLFQLVDCEPGRIANTTNRLNMHVIMFISKWLADPETRFTTTKQEE